MSFIDEIDLTITAGTGGAGCASFRHEKYIEFGGPFGGNGGKGSSVYFIGDENLISLLDYRYKQKINAENGEPGRSKGQTGLSAEDLYLAVPLGTIIFQGGNVLGEIIKHNETFLVCRGGRGGLGNMALANKKDRCPKYAFQGVKGEVKNIHLELKVLSDIGLIGLPSVGKSSILNQLTSSKAKIGAYDFTTLSPNLGILQYFDKDYVIADLPGLIEGAAQGKGLGLTFLKHAQRCKVFFHVLDGSQTLDELKTNYSTIRNELSTFDEKLLNKFEVLLVNKIDLLDNLKIDQIRDIFKDKDIFFVSCYAQTGFMELMNFVYEIIKDIKVEEYLVDNKRIYTNLDEELLTVDKVGLVFYLRGKKIKDLVDKYDLDNDEALKRFNLALDKLNINQYLLDAGAEYGNIVNIYGKEVEFKE
jgi:GTP-binding protein